MKAQQILKSLTGIVAGLTIATSAYAADSSFQSSLKILTPLSITAQSGLDFPDTESTAAQQTVVVAPTDAGAADFNIAGELNEAVTASVVEPSVTMTVGSTNIVVDTFTFGGALAADGSGTLDGTGALAGAKVGGTATVPANAESGTYTGTLTFRVTYQ